MAAAEEQKMPPPMIGITQSALNALSADPRVHSSMTTEQLCHEVIMQDTTAEGWTLRSDKTPEGWTVHSYINELQEIEFLRQPGMSPPEGCISYCESLALLDSIGRSNRFISHAWRLTFVELVEAVTAGLLTEGSLVRNLETSELGTIVRCQDIGVDSSVYTVDGQDGVQQSLSAALLEPMHDGDTPVYLWLDVVTINQHEPEKVSKGFSSTFMECVGDIGHTLMVIETFHIHKAVVFSRSWCVWELYCTHHTGAALTFCLSMVQRRELVNYLQRGTMVWNSSDRSVDSANAQAGAEMDRAKIADAIAASVGHRTLDQMANSLRAEWSATVMQSALEGLRGEDGQLNTCGAIGGAMSVAGLLASSNQHAAAGDIYREIVASCERLAASEPDALADDASQRSLRNSTEVARPLLAFSLERRGLYSASLSQWEMALKEPYIGYDNRDCPHDIHCFQFKPKEDYARCLALDGKFQMANAIYEEIIACDGDQWDVQRRYARVLRKQGAYSKALDELLAIEDKFKRCETENEFELPPISRMEVKLDQAIVLRCQGRESYANEMAAEGIALMASADAGRASQVLTNYLTDLTGHLQIMPY